MRLRSGAGAASFFLPFLRFIEATRDMSSGLSPTESSQGAPVQVRLQQHAVCGKYTVLLLTAALGDGMSHSAAKLVATIIVVSHCQCHNCHG